MTKKKNMMLFIAVFIGFFACSAISPSSSVVADELSEYAGMCDASAAVGIGASHFVAANDEDNILRVYRSDGAEAEAIQSFDLGPFLNLDARHPEADIEASARVGELVYWITSHGRNKKAKHRSSRHKLFATQVERNANNSVDIRFVGRPYESLLQDIAGSRKLNRFKLEEAAQYAPKQEGALNIEGLSSTPGGSLLIAFRNPVPDGKALLIALENPQEVIAGKAARLGDPILLSLDGMGIRGMAYSKGLGEYIIIAGPYDHQGDFKLFLWSGLASEEAELIKGVDLHGLHPESLIVYPDKKIQLLSDDGMKRVGGERCKHVAPEKRRFRSIWINEK